MIQRRYGRIKPPSLPFSRMLKFGMLPPPPTNPVADYREFCGPIKDQGQEGSCTGHASTETREWIGRRYLLQKKVFSPQYTYVKELIRQGDFPKDVGSDGVTLCESAVYDGFCELDLFPYVAGQIRPASALQDQNAAEHRLGAYHGLVGSLEALRVIGDAVPWPVLVGFTVYESFESDELAKTGVMAVPGHKERQLGGHEVTVTGGYDIGLKPTLRPSNCPPAVLVQNSYGVDWGLKGFFWMPLEILDNPDTDLKIMHSGKPWHRWDVIPTH